MLVSLEQILKSRDDRQQTQRQLMQEYPDKTLICMTVVMPGSEKRNNQSLIVANAGKQELEKIFKDKIIYSQANDLQTGYELYLIVNLNYLKAKTICCNIEENHPLGRLFDIDVFDPSGVPVMREEAGFAKRKCLICENEARFCMRNFTHTQEEIQQHINKLINSYTGNLKA
ncbi:MAG: citrate lyase holo-[Bacteroidales bacterium]|nr:citrate lyase holo-[acyl-carrier protein] synthase [Bacteroidales bacterium]